MEGENKETKITSVEKERVKDPRRVEQGKKLATISREAKKRKAMDRAEREAEQQRQTEAEFLSPYVFVIPAIGVTLGGCYLYHFYRPNDGKEEPSKEDRLEKRDRREESRKKPNLEKL